MATIESISYVDDIDGSEADGPVAFTLDGRDYEIDLSHDNAQRLRDILAPYLEGARKLSKNAKPTKVGIRRSKEELQAIRDWAATNGLVVAPRGRIAEEIVIRYNNRNAA